MPVLISVFSWQHGFAAGVCHVHIQISMNVLLACRVLAMLLVTTALGLSPARVMWDLQEADSFVKVLYCNIPSLYVQCRLESQCTWCLHNMPSAQYPRG